MKLKKNTFIQGAFIATLGIVISKILGIIYVIPFYAVIGDQGGALYGYAYNIYSIFLGISQAGLPLAMSKIISEYNALGYYETKGIIETKEVMAILELSNEDIDSIMQNMKSEFEEQNRGIEIIKVENGYQMCSKKEYYDYIYPIFDNRAKPSLSAAALETLSIIAYNPKITRA